MASQMGAGYGVSSSVKATGNQCSVRWDLETKGPLGCSGVADTLVLHVVFVVSVGCDVLPDGTNPVLGHCDAHNSSTMVATDGSTAL